MTVLLVDVGNTALKWCELKSAAYQGESASNADFFTRVNRCARDPQAFIADVTERQLTVSQVWVGSVASAEFDEQFHTMIAAALSAQVRFAHSEIEFAGLVNSYQEPQRMGVDRWLAMLAAWKDLSSPVVVVDAGTAITIDLVTGSGQHQGGYIIPGAALMDSALTRETQRVRYEGEPRRAIDPGRSTAECVSAGVWVAAFGSVQWVVQQYPNYQVMVTGGDGEALLELGLKGEWRPNLVLEGLALVAAADSQPVQ